MQHVFNGGRNVLNEGGDYHVQLETACSDVGLQGRQRQPLEWMKKLLFLSHEVRHRIERGSDLCAVECHKMSQN